MNVRTPLILAALACGAAAAAAGTVTVAFTDPARYADAGTSRWDEQGNLRSLARHLERLGQERLAPNQQLRVEVLDVDLAGTVLPSRRDGTLLRTLRGRADWPRIHLRYTLESNGTVVASGDDWVSDLDYMRSSVSALRNEPLHYEKRMLTRWFDARFGPQVAAH
jgi:hypothetical protein